MSLEVEINAKDTPKWDTSTQTFREWRKCFEMWPFVPKVAHFYKHTFRMTLGTLTLFSMKPSMAKKLKKKKYVGCVGMCHCRYWKHVTALAERKGTALGPSAIVCFFSGEDDGFTTS